MRRAANDGREGSAAISRRIVAMPLAMALWTLATALGAMTAVGETAGAVAEVPTGAVAGAPAGSAGGLRVIQVDAAATVGILRSLQGVGGVPAPGHAKPFGFGPSPPRDQNIDVSEGYRLARIDLVRTHDAYGAGDIDAQFVPPKINLPMMARVPSSFDVGSIFKNPTADPNEAASYNFGPTDAVMASIHAIGADAIFRLGRSEGADTAPPADFDRYAAVVKHVVMHYNRGWAQGFHYGIKYWEVWNEPDLANWFWDGTPEQYYAFYDKVAHAVKSADPKAWVGGPAIALPNDPTPYRERFFDHVRDHHLPFDFLSWHWYAVDDADPYVFTRIANNLQGILREHGLGRVPTLLDEWNGGFRLHNPGPGAPPDPAPGDPVGAAYIAAAIAYMQDSPILKQTIYRADADFGTDGKTPNRHGQAFIATGHMKDTPIRLSAVGGDLDGLAVQAGKSADSRIVQVLIVNYQVPAEAMGPRPGGDVAGVPGFFKQAELPRRTLNYHDNAGYDLRIDHLKVGRYSVSRYRIDADHEFSLLDTQTMTGAALHLTAAMPPPAVELVIAKALDR